MCLRTCVKDFNCLYRESIKHASLKLPELTRKRSFSENGREQTFARSNMAGVHAALPTIYGNVDRPHSKLTPALRLVAAQALFVPPKLGGL